MSYNRDEVFDMLYNDEFSKIPFAFRFGKMRIKIVMGLMILFCAASCIIPTVLLIMHIPGFCTTLITLALITALLTGWMVISITFEKRAFNKAQILSYRYQVYAEEKAKERLSKWRIHTL